MKREAWVSAISCAVLLLAGCNQPEPPRIVEVTREVTTVVTNTPAPVAEAPANTPASTLDTALPTDTATVSVVQPRVAPSETPTAELPAASATAPKSESESVTVTQGPEESETPESTTATATAPNSESEVQATRPPARRQPETPTATPPQSQGEGIPRIITPTTPSRVLLRTRIVAARVTPQLPVLVGKVTPKPATTLVVKVNTPRNGATLNRSLVFQVMAYDPVVGTHNGDGIDRVEMYAIDANGKTRHKQTELHAVYCLFGGTNEACTPFVFAERNLRWPNGDPIQTGVHKLRAVVFAKSGATTTIETTVRLVVGR